MMITLNVNGRTAQAGPVAFHRQLLAAYPRHAGALKLAADKADWSTPLAPGRNGEKRGRVSPYTSRSTLVLRRLRK